MTDRIAIHNADCLDLLTTLGEAGAAKAEGTLALAYFDPPFFSQKNYGGLRGKTEFHDRWESIDHYLDYIELRASYARANLRPDGSFMLHCDWHASHYLKVRLDKIFGYENFRNEIIWCYLTRAAPGKHFPRKHDTILWWAKSKDTPFYADAIQVKRGETTPHGHFNKDGIGSDKSKENKKSLLAMIDKNTKTPPDFEFDLTWLLDPVGVRRGGRDGKSVWQTQKPLALMRRLILATTQEDDIG